MAEMNVDSLRTPYESNTEWRVRRAFLQAHWNRFEESRLVCLSHCYLNVRQMGCNYPMEVMRQLNELGKNLDDNDLSDVTNLPSRIKGVEPVKFVRSTETPEQANTGKTRSLNQSSVGNVGTSFGPSPPKKVVPVFGMSFIKSSSEYKSTDVAMHEVQPQTKSGQKAVGSSLHTPTRAKGHSGLGYGTPKYSTEGISDMDTRFKTLSNAIKDIKQKFGTSKNSIEILQMAVDKVKMSLDCSIRDVVGSQFAHTFVCNLTIDLIEVGEGKGTNKKTAKHTAFDSAVAKLSSAYLSVDQSNLDKQVLCASNEALMPPPYKNSNTTTSHQNFGEKMSYKNLFLSDYANSHNSYNQFYNPSQSYDRPYSKCYDSSYDGSKQSEVPEMYESNLKAISIGNKRKSNTLQGDITKFIIFENLNVETYNAMAVLRQSCDINKALLEFHYSQEPNNVNMNCRIHIEGKYITDVSGVGKINCKTLACLKAIDQLRRICWTIKIKQTADCPADDSLSRDAVMGEIQKQVESISNDNIGNKLLRKMGWSGGGVGAEGNIGREEPVAVSMQQIVRREGLGLNSVDGMKDFRSKIRTVVENYAKSDTQEDLAFTSDFTKEERAYIHTISQRLGLKSLSRGKGEDRHLTLSRKRTTNQLFDHLVREGGSTHKYELVPPEGEEMY